MAASTTDTYGLGDPSMLEKIDKLFACGIGEQVNLPQIVVVGDQSSGKSSVLEGLIRKPLPRDSGLCTRFATQIVFRRSKDDGITVSIIADRDASLEDRQRLEAWSKADVTALDSETFSGIMREAHQIMGLSTGRDQPGSTFSNHVLRLEITGPDQEHLSVIDVPGIFRNPTPGVTTKADITLVKSMVLGYMENPRSVMLAVIPANVDVATQEILDLAADVDPDGDRTLGVLTKPDLVDRGAENNVIDLIEGRSRPMKLGWHVVRNPGQQDLSDSTLNRNELEIRFFRETAPWKSLGMDLVGTESLRSRLKEVLSSLVTREFPGVKNEIIKKLKSAQESSKRLGPERGTSQMQQTYLIEIATGFQRLVQQALDAKYGSDEVFEKYPALRLANAITARFTCFSRDMARHGSYYSFSTHANDSEAVLDISNPPFEPADDDLKSVMEVRQTKDNHLNIQDILHPQEEVSAPTTANIDTWLRQVYETSRGFELGTFGTSILSTTMKKQSSNWVSISLGYISDIVVIVHDFITAALDAICSDAEVKAALENIMIDGLSTRYNKAIEQVKFLLNVERSGTPMTANHYFNENLEKSRQKRFVSLMTASSIHDSKLGKIVRLDDNMRNQSMGNAEHTVCDIHDILQSYYKVSLKRFVDNVFKQATDHYLLNGPETPLNLLSPILINSLAPEDLEYIAGEAPKTRRWRSQLKKEIASLEEARKILARG